MKTSKRILFSYIGLLALSFLAFVIYLTSVDHESKSKRENNYEQISEDLPDFNYISVDRISLNISGSDKSKISIYVEKGKELPDIAYRCLNDTLYVDFSDKYHSVNLDLPNIATLHVTSNNGVVWMRDIQVDTLNYTGMDDSELRGFNDCMVSVVKADVMNSRFFAFNGSMDQLTIKAIKSRVNVQCKLASVAGEISDNTELRIKNATSMNVNKDHSSRFYCYP